MGLGKKVRVGGAVNAGSIGLMYKMVGKGG